MHPQHRTIIPRNKTIKIGFIWNTMLITLQLPEIFRRSEDIRLSKWNENGFCEGIGRSA
jgi:hypothetical protein